MPYKNIKQRKQYHAKYMRDYLKNNPLDTEQLKRKREVNKLWREKNQERLKAYQAERYKKDKEKIAIRAKEYRSRNDEQIKIKKQKYYQDNKEMFNKKSFQYSQDNKEKIREYKKIYSHSSKSRFRSYHNSAKKRGYDFNLSYEQFDTLFNGNCHYCNIESSKGVDRMDNSIGYEIENSVSCCKTCNYMKSNMTYNSFKEQICKIFKHLIR